MGHLRTSKLQDLFTEGYKQVLVSLFGLIGIDMDMEGDNNSSTQVISTEDNRVDSTAMDMNYQIEEDYNEDNSRSDAVGEEELRDRTSVEDRYEEENVLVILLD